MGLELIHITAGVVVVGIILLALVLKMLWRVAEPNEAVIAQQLAENWPEIVRAGAGALGNVDHMVVLNGADGVADLLTTALAMGGTGLGLARRMLASMGDRQDPAATTDDSAPVAVREVDEPAP